MVRRIQRLFGCRRALALAILSAGLWAQAGADQTSPPPARVVSMNVCTDQLAILLAAPGQLIAVSHFAHEPRMAALVDQARAYPAIHGRAEEIFLLKPDLVITGTFSNYATAQMLRRLGVKVVTMAPAASFDGIRANIRTIGAALGRDQQAADLIAVFDADLAAARRDLGDSPPRVALHAVNSYTSGAGTLAHDALTAAGLANVAAEQGTVGMARLPLELLVMSAPDLVIRGRAYDAPALSQQTFTHPAFLALAAQTDHAPTLGADTVCGGPFTANAVRALAAVRDRLTHGGTDDDSRN